MNYQLSIDGTIGPWGWSKQVIRRVLNSYKSKHVDINITSLGGNLDHALDIRQQFKDHGDVTVYLTGFVASAATVIAMGAKRIVMSKYAMFLVHKCSNFIDAWGSYNADQMQSLIEELEANKKENDKIDVVLANMYADKCKKNVSEILDILKEGRWLTADEALSLGFIDEISEFDSGDAKTNCYGKASYPEILCKLNALGISTLGLEPPSKSNQKTTNPPTMKKFNFSTVESLLKMDSITPDNDQEVTVTAEQLEEINNRLENLERENRDNAAAIAAKDAEITSLKEQVENLKQAPGDETSEIEDEAGDEKVSSADLFNSIKSRL